MQRKWMRSFAALAAVLALASPAVAAAAPEPAESQRMSRAKDLIADEQWARAIQELRAAADDPREKNRDEALFWLAHSQNQIMEFAPAVETIRRLEREFPSSRWVKPARSLLIELAQALQRNDFLWWTAAPPAPAPAAVPPGTPRPADAPVVAPAPPRAGRVGAAPRGRGPQPAPPATPVAPPASATPAPAPLVTWVAGDFHPDTDLRIQALGSLIHTDADKVIPMLRNIALEADNPAARRAVFVLASSKKPAAQSTVVEVAKKAAEPVRIAAVRELARFGGPDVSQTLLQVYSTANEPVKLQVVQSLGQRSATSALLRIAQSERDRGVRDTAIVTLGRAGGRDELRTLYGRSSGEAKRTVITVLCTARAEDELIRIAGSEKTPALRAEAVSCLRRLNTPKARSFLEERRR